MQKNLTKAVTPHGETRPFFFFSFLARKIIFKYQTESINASIKFFFQEPGKWFFLFYRTGLKRVFLQSFCFIIKIIQGKWHDFFFRVFFFFFWTKSSRGREREEKKNLTNSKTSRQKLHTMGKTSKIVINYSVTKLKYW